MKKFAMIMALALPLALASCGDDDNTTLTLDRGQATLDYNTTTELKASEKGGTWASSNEFVASVDKNGKVTANHEGQAVITVSKDGMSASCKVTVNATNDNFNTILTWGATPTQIKTEMAKEPNLVLLLEQGDNLMYSLPNEAYPWYGFIFKNGGLAGSSIYFTDAMFDQFDFNGYLNQRYAKVETTEDGAVYANGNSLSEASVAVTVGYDTDEDVWTALWEPVSHTKAAALDATLMKDAKSLYKAAKK